MYRPLIPDVAYAALEAWRISAEDSVFVSVIPRSVKPGSQQLTCTPPLPPSLEMNTNIGLMIVVAAMTFSPVVCLRRVGGYFRGGAFSGSFATPHPSEDERSKSCRPDCMKKMVNPIPPRCNGKTNDRCCYEICNPARWAMLCLHHYEVLVADVRIMIGMILSANFQCDTSSLHAFGFSKQR